MNSNIDITIDYLNICLGYTKAHVHSNLINFIILSAKYFIFKTKYMKTIPDIAAYKSYLNKRIEIEQHIAFQKDKLDQHNAKWQNTRLFKYIKLVYNSYTYRQKTLSFLFFLFLQQIFISFFSFD